MRSVRLSGVQVTGVGGAVSVGEWSVVEVGCEGGSDRSLDSPSVVDICVSLAPAAAPDVCTLCLGLAIH